MTEYITLYVTEYGGESSFEIEAERLAALVKRHYDKTLEEFMADHDSCDTEEIRAWMSLPEAVSFYELESIFEEYKGKTGWRGLDAESAIESFIRFVKRRV